MASGPITLRQTDEEKVEAVTDFIFLGSKITADSDWSHGIKRCLLLGRKATTNLGGILKTRDITLLTKVHLVKAMFFPAVVYGCESWTIKAEHWKTDAFESWYWIRLLRVPWTARRSNQSILQEMNPEYSLEGLMLKLKLQYFHHLMRRADSGKDPDSGNDWRQKEKGATDKEMVAQCHRLNEHAREQTPGDSGGQGSLPCYSPRGQKVGHDLVTE